MYTRTRTYVHTRDLTLMTFPLVPGVCLRGHSVLRGPCCVFLNQMEVFIGQQIQS